MTTEQGGAPSASAGGAPAPDFTALGKVLVDAGRKLTQAFVDAGIFTADSWSPRPTQPDPRDAEIERLRDQLGEVCTALHNQLSDYDECGVFTRDHALYLVRQLGGRVRLRDMTIKAMHEMARPFGGPDPRDAEKLGRDKQFADLVAERDRKRRELADVTAERDRLRQELDLIGGSANGEFLAAEAEVPPEPPVGTVFVQERGYTWTRKADGWHCSREGCENCPADWESEVCDRVRAGSIRHLPGARATARPAEPRRWVAGDAEPEIGTTITWGFGGTSWTRCGDGVWRSDICKCKSCRTAPGLSWTVLIAEARAPLDEVVTSDG